MCDADELLLLLLLWLWWLHQCVLLVVVRGAKVVHSGHDHCCQYSSMHVCSRSKWHEAGLHACMQPTNKQQGQGNAALEHIKGSLVAGVLHTSAELMKHT